MSYSPTTVAAYVRVSSKAQDYASQKAAIERAAASR
jgi:DNA invertase Pin-like site-specific DNA recombinase